MTKSCVQREKFFRTQNSSGKAYEARPTRSSQQKKAGAMPAFLLSIRSAVSISGGSRSTPTEPVVHADLGGVFVVAEAAAGDVGRACRKGGVAEIVILVLGLGRPVRGEHVFKAALHAAEEAGVAALQGVVAREGAADVAADIKAGPVIDHLRRGIGRRLGVGARR